MSGEKRIGEIIRLFADMGVQMQRVPISFSFGTEEECKELFYSALMAVDKSITDIVSIPEHKIIIDWMVDTKGKGLFFAGSCGRGKTCILSYVIPLLFKMVHNKLLMPIQARDLNSEKNLLKRWAYCIDDIGTESIKNDYGEKTELFAEIMSDAEQYFKPVFVSTNLTGQDVINRYGKRTMDRIVHLCTIVRFQGDSFRH